MTIVHTGLAYLLLVSLAYLWLFSRDKQKAQAAIKTGALALINILPFLLAIFALIGLVQEFLPPTMIESVLGSGNRFLSLLMGGLLGAVAIGPPLAAYPIAGSLLASGAWPPTVAAFMPD